MAINPQDVKKLRDKTGAGFGDCKKALEAANGDFAAAEKKLKEMGAASAEKRSGRSAEEGRVFTYVSSKGAGILNLSCETDFVARNESFVEFGNKLIKELVEGEKSSVGSEYDPEIKEIAALIKENVNVRDYSFISLSETDKAVDYIHGEGRIGVLIKLSSDDPNKVKDAKVQELGLDLALHAAAYNPQFLSRDAVDPDFIKENEEIFRAQVAKMDKPEKVMEGIIKGKLNKHLSSVVFLNQGFVKDDKLSVEQAIKGVSKELGTALSLTDYKYFAI
jgi:elongation factor Ts